VGKRDELDGMALSLEAAIRWAKRYAELAWEKAEKETDPSRKQELEKITIEEAVHECSQDEPFYRNSDGGVTLSGGEPLYQPEFALHFLKASKEKSLSTALDMCGHAPWEVLEDILEAEGLSVTIGH